MLVRRLPPNLRAQRRTASTAGFVKPGGLFVRCLGEPPASESTSGGFPSALCAKRRGWSPAFRWQKRLSFPVESKAESDQCHSFSGGRTPFESRQLPRFPGL